MDLIRILEERGLEAPPERTRGARYQQEGRVLRVLQEGEITRAEVKGTQVYWVSLLHTDRDPWLYACSCPASSTHRPCKHVWAVCFELESRKAQGLLEVGSGAKAPAALERGLQRARGLLNKLHHGPRDPWERAAEEWMRLEYHVLAGPSRQSGSLAIALRQRRKRKDGVFGSPTPLERAF